MLSLKKIFKAIQLSSTDNTLVFTKMCAILKRCTFNYVFLSVFWSLHELIGWFSNRTGTSHWRQLTTARANQTTGLTNGRAANWAPEAMFSPFRALSRRQLTFPSSCYITNVTSISHDFPWPTIKIHDFQGLEYEIIKFHDFPGFPWRVRSLIIYLVPVNVSLPPSYVDTWCTSERCQTQS